MTCVNINDGTDLYTCNSDLRSFVHTNLTPHNIIPGISKSLNPSNQLSLLHQNLRSLNKHHDDFHHFLTSLNMDFHIIGMTETWIYDTNLAKLSDFQLKNYHLELVCRDVGGGGGVGAYINLQLQYEVLNNISVIDCESLWLKIKVNNQNIVVGVIYRSSTIKNAYPFIVDLDRVLNVLQHEGLCCILCGDINLDLMTLNISHSYIQTLFSYGFSTTNIFPSRIVNNPGTLLDHINTNIINTHITSGVIYNDISDHLATYAILHNLKINNSDRTESNMYSTWNFRSYIKTKFLSDLQHCEMNEVLNINDPEQAFNTFLFKFKKCCDDNLSIITKRNKNTPRKPWITKSLLSCIQNKHKLYSRILKNDSDITIEYFTRYKNTLTNILKKAKLEYFHNLFELAGNDSRKTWTYIKNILKANTKESLPSKIVKDDTTITDVKMMADMFNDFFINVGPKLAEKINSHYDHTTMLTNTYNSSAFFAPVINKEIDALINEVNIKKAIGHDGIHPKLIKDSKSFITPYITYIANLILLYGKFPDNLKIAVVLPLYKAGDPTQVTNYRPISILSTFSKLFEKIIMKRLMDFLNKHNVLSSNQFGFRKNIGTNHALISYVEQLYLNLEKSNDVVSVFLDLSKAFDTVDHNILVSKLEHYGIRGVCLELFYDYLSDRKQSVSIAGSNSDQDILRCGVPQGSILGPILFLIYINDLPNVLTYSDAKLYADDTTISCSHQIAENLQENLNSDLAKLSKWFLSNKLTLNVQKSNFCVFTNNKLEIYNYNIQIGNLTLAEKNSVKYLGLVIDNKLRWNAHISFVLGKISRYVGIFNKLKQYVPTQTLLLLYNSLIYPHLIYAVEIWGNASKTSLNPILLLQKKLVRIICGSDYLAHSAPLFNVCKILDI